jgi:hypothetical protein
VSHVEHHQSLRHVADGRIELPLSRVDFFLILLSATPLMSRYEAAKREKNQGSDERVESNILDGAELALFTLSHGQRFLLVSVGSARIRDKKEYYPPVELSGAPTALNP